MLTFEEIIYRLRAEADDCERRARLEDQKGPESRRLNVVYGCGLAAQKLRDVAAHIEAEDQSE